MDNKLLAIIGEDKIGRKTLHMIEQQGLDSKVKIVIDKSSNLKRIIRLIRKRVLKLNWCVKMFIAELLRPNYTVKNTYPAITTNNELADLIQEKGIETVLLFRAGLIINKKVLSLPVDVLNIHYARIPEYGGLGSLIKALKDKAYNQCATLHRVTTRIDEGQVLDEHDFTLSPKLAYHKNELIASNAGVELMLKTLNRLTGN